MQNFNAKIAFGFNGEEYITCLTGDKNIIKSLKQQYSYIRYNLLFGYYVPSTCAIPPLPNSIISKKIFWEQIKDPNRENRLLPIPQLFNILQETPLESQPQKIHIEIGQSIECNVLVKQDLSHTALHSYLLIDKNNNMYIWNTKAVQLTINSKIHIRMKIKSYTKYLNNDVISVWYCKIL